MQKRLLVAAIMSWMALSSGLQAKEKVKKPSEEAVLSFKRVLRLSIQSSINPATLNYLTTGYRKAESEGYQGVLIEINTPGGLVSTTKQILTLMGDALVPTVVWVAPEGASATSAGALIASGAHLLVMAEGTNIGAATPITMGKDIEQGDAKNKAINDLVALVQSLSQARGRNPAPFAEMIEKAASFTSKDALKAKLIDGIVDRQADFASFLDQRSIHFHGRKVKLDASGLVFETFDMDMGQRLLDVLANPNLAYVLFLAGAALLYFELQAPGGIIAGALGVLLLLLSGIGFQVLPLNFGALGLIVLAFILFVLEVYVTSYGILTLAAMASLVSGSLFLFRTDDAYLSVSLSLIVSTCVAIALFVGFVLAFWIRDARRSKHSGSIYDLAGKEAKVLKVLEHEGSLYFYQVRVAGETWRAVSSQTLHKGQTCRVLGSEEKMLIKIEAL